MACHTGSTSDPSTVTPKSPPLSPALRGELGSQKRHWALPPGAYRPRGGGTRTSKQTGLMQTLCGPGRRAACAISDPGKDPAPTDGDGERTSRKFNPEDWLPLCPRGEQTLDAGLFPGCSSQKELRTGPCVGSQLARFVFPRCCLWCCASNYGERLGRGP